MTTSPVQHDPLGSTGRPRRVGVLVPAAGSGSRMGGRRKAFLSLRGEPVLLRALRPLLAHPEVVAVRIALAREDAASPPPWLRDLDPRVGCVAGGSTRSDSVRAALAALPAAVDVVLVHDAARPLVSPELVARCVAAVDPAGDLGAISGFRAIDTMKETDDQGRVVATPDRSRLWHAQTPQVFPRALLERAYAGWDGAEATDDAVLVERAGGRVVMVEGPATNLKVTRPEDLPLAEALLDMAGPGN